MVKILNIEIDQFTNQNQSKYLGFTALSRINFAYSELIVYQRWMKTGVPGEKHLTYWCRTVY